MDPITGSLGSGAGSGARKPTRNLQPRAAAALDFNEDSDDDDGGLLSADYKAQRRTTQDLVDFFNNAPPPPPPPALAPIVEEEKKKRSLLQRLRSKKSNSSINGSNGASSMATGNRSSVLMPSANGSSISTNTALTVSRSKNGKEYAGDAANVGTLPNGKKYIMIAVDYKDKDGAGGGSTESGSALASGASSLNNVSRHGPSSITTGSSSRRQSRALEDDHASASARRMSTLSSHITTTTTVYDGSNGTNGATEKRRSILLQPNSAPSASDGSMFGLDSMLGNFAIDTDFISTASNPAGAGSADGTNGSASAARPNSRISKHGPASPDTATAGEDMSRTGSKRGNKVTFSIHSGQPALVPLDEASVDAALAQRLATHKAAQQSNGTVTSKSTSSNGASNPGHRTLEEYPEITLPKPVSRKKVRHVQIQTQHCIMRPMYTQTDASDVLVHDLEVKEWSTQTSDNASEAGTCTSTMVASEVAASTSTVASASVNGANASGTMATVTRANSKVASLVASLTQPTAATTATTTTLASPTAMASRAQNTSSTSGTQTNASAQTTASLGVSTEKLSNEDFSNATPAELQAELLQMRQQNAQLQSQVTTLERDLASEIRARTRTAVAMQDTRDKFEMLSAMAYKKLKEMIFQRHVLEMEIRELRAQVDLQGEESVYLQQQQQRNVVTVGQN
ncbi:hypothetical protein BG004_005002 [Podila humilis]|nr:hypothetical protein BG004_005002 [Podila humilis]